jgi:uncharacterized protein (TIGR03083 family)
MFDLEGARGVAFRELNAMISEVEALDAALFDRATRCQGWVVRDVVAHTGLAALRQAEAFRRAQAGNMEPPEFPGVPGLDVAGTIAQLHQGAQEIDEALAGLTPEVMSGLVPLPFGVLPAPVAIQIPLYEYAFHRNDVAWALGERKSLPADVAANFIGFVPGLAPMLAARGSGGAEEPPVLAYRIVAPAGTIELVNNGKGFEVAELSGDVATCVIEGDDSSVSLFVMGRLPADDSALRNSGDVPGAANDFKRWFPGP